MKHFLVVILLLSFLYSFAQHPVYYQISNENGLPTNEVYKIVQDGFGYIWIGCDAGIYRYDGFTYKQYSNSKQNARSTSFLQIDSKQRLWAKNFFGQIYRVDGDSLKIIKQFETANPSYPQFVLDEKCNLWTYNKNRLIEYNENGDSLTSYDIINPCEEIIALKFFHGTLYLLFRDLSIVKFDIRTKQHEHFKSNQADGVTTQSCTLIEHQNHLYLLVELERLENKYRIYKMDENNFDKFYDFELPKKNDRIYSIFSDGKDLWTTSSFGVFKISNPKNIYFNSEKISSMLLDQEGEFWFSSLQSGLFVIPQIEVIKYNSANSTLTDNNLTCIKAIDKNHLQIGSYQGVVFEFDRSANTIHEKYKNETEHFISVKAIEKNEKYTIVSRGRFNIIENTTGKQFFPCISNIRDMKLVGDTLYLLHSTFIAKSSLSETVKTLKGKYTYYNKTGGRAIEYDKENKIMYALLSDGVYCFNSNGKKEEILDGKEKIVGVSVCDKNDIVWIATVSKGIYAFENKKIKYHFSIANLLKENTVRTFNVDGNYLWVCTENYLQRINFLTDGVGLFNTTQSINPKDINSIEFLGDSVYLATKKGLVTFPKNMNWENRVIPSIRIKDVFINNKLVPKSYQFELPYNNKNIKINVASIALKSKGNYNYKYRLIGLDSNWISIDASSPSVLFSTIPPGIFVFQVCSVNEQGLSSNIKSLFIFVETPFWQRWWFYVLIVIITFFFVALFYNTRIRYIRKKADLKNKLVASQLTALKSQMNPHFMFNALNSIQDLVLNHDIKNSNLYISKFSTLMRKVLDASGTAEITLQNEVEILELYLSLEKLRFGDEFQFKLIIDKEIDSDYIHIPSMILQPFVENAIKHGLLHKKKNKLLTIEFSLNSILICTITDNGIGRKHSEEIKKRQNAGHTSFATLATEERIDLLNSNSDQQYSFETIDLFEEEQATGTKVIITIPLRNS